jgi:hypothetical protein
MTPEQQARQEIDRLLQSEGWHVCGVADANIRAAWRARGPSMYSAHAVRPRDVQRRED